LKQNARLRNLEAKNLPRRDHECVSSGG
jgi:hypothetical protein